MYRQKVGPESQTMDQSPDRGCWRLKVLCLALMAALCLGLLSAGAWASREQEVKAAIIYNVAKFVEWPTGALPDPAEPMVLGVAESDPLADDLGILTGKSLHGRRLVVRKIHRSDEFKKCQIAFLSAAGRKTATSAFAHLAGLPILTITDEAENVAQTNIIINLVPAAGNIKFQVNLKAARRAGLKISSQLLKLAEVIDGSE